jgi:mannose-1-phosphate guanylyltransferase
MTKIVPVVLSGGSGMRLWPVSREGCPKPFIHLADGQTLLEKTYYRLTNLALKEIDELMPIMTVTNRDYYYLSHDELRKTGKSGTFLLEPVGRNTAPAIGSAAHLIAQQYDLDAILLVMPADHLIANQAQFIRTMRDAIEIAKLGYLLTFGIVPTHPDTGFGYIECGSQGVTGSYEVAKFIEKPNLAVAQQLFMTGKHLWNSGMFCFSAKTILNELEQHAPQLNQQILHCWQSMQHTNNESIYELPKLAFEQITDISIDYAVMEYSYNTLVLPADFGWNDIGSWQVFSQLIPEDSQHNRVNGDALLIDTTNTFVQAENRLIATLGVRDLVIIDTTDALLVSHADSAQRVKEIVSALRDRSHDSAYFHKTVLRPWGTYTVLEEGPGFKVKRIEVKPGASLSLQIHHQRSEHWVVVQGIATVINGDAQLQIHANESTYIPAGNKHRLSNLTNEQLIMIEVQSGPYLGEDDIVRLTDNYGRT